ncbi:MAG TPA: histidine kinase [Nitrospiraceae bacterium]|jgi:PAS domain S-box-containing protein|nr:histidine kinase [Nitrospiraceae bacterium]
MAELKGFERDSKSAEEMLQLTRFTVDNVADAVYWMDSKAQIADVNETACSMLGYTREELLNLTVFNIDPDFTAEKWVEAWDALKGQGKMTLETKHRTKDGRIIPVEIMANYVSFGGRELDCAFARDITKRKLVEKRLEASLREKETLLRELYHRTKNNMQVISNLIDLQVVSVVDEQTVKLFRETQNRIKAMALVHEKLYQSKDLSNLNLKDYASDLANALLESYRLSADRISFKLDAENISVSIDTATPCGLIIAELMSNALKHAFPSGQRGEISLALHQSEEGEIDIRFSDNGIGLPKGFGFRTTRSLGLNLVKNLTEKQLMGTIELNADHSTEFHIKFKEPLYKKNG